MEIVNTSSAQHFEKLQFSFWIPAFRSPSPIPSGVGNVKLIAFRSAILEFRKPKTVKRQQL